MSWNKTSISSNASLSQIAQKFSLKERFTGSHHLRAKTNGKGETVIYEKHFSITKFQAILGNKKAKAAIREQRQFANDILSGKVSKEYGEHTVSDIQLRDHATLRGYQVEALQAHAVVAAAAEQMGLNRSEMDADLKQAFSQMARDHVYAMPLEASAEDRIDAAKLFLIQNIAEDSLSFHFRDQPDVLKERIQDLHGLCKKLPYSNLGRQLDVNVATGLSTLLKTEENPDIDNLAKHVSDAKKRRDSKA